MTIFDIFTFFGILVMLAGVRFLGSYILSMLTGMGTNNDELLGAWMIDICITSIVIAGVITYLYTKGFIIVQ